MAAAVVALLESLRDAGRLRSAGRIARRMLERITGDLARSMAIYELALVESELADDLEGARQLARDALEITPKELRHYPLAALGVIALKRGRYREASLYLEQATEAGAVAPLLQQLAMARLGSGDADGAAEALEVARTQGEGGLDQELLGHVRRMRSLIESLPVRQRASRADSGGDR
jgi:tetratricopeptide (TPR) repeat protein